MVLRGWILPTLASIDFSFRATVRLTCVDVEWNVSATFGWIVIKFGTDIHSPFRMNFDNFWRSSNFPSGAITAVLWDYCSFANVSMANDKPAVSIAIASRVACRCKHLAQSPSSCVSIQYNANCKQISSKSATENPSKCLFPSMLLSM